MVMLGIADDLFDIRWRNKVLLPAIASIPLLAVYYVDYNLTTIVVPTPFRSWLPALIDLGWIYYLWMAALAIFCTNSINILAGINGLEVGQSIILAICIVINDFLYLLRPNHPAKKFSLDFYLFFIAVYWGKLCSHIS